MQKRKKQRRLKNPSKQMKENKIEVGPKNQPQKNENNKSEVEHELEEIPSRPEKHTKEHRTTKLYEEGKT